jgi:hypothetical protein
MNPELSNNLDELCTKYERVGFITGLTEALRILGENDAGRFARSLIAERLGKETGMELTGGNHG